MAEEILQQNLSSLHRSGKRDEELAICLSDLSAVYEQEKRLPEAERTLKELIHVERELFWPEHPFVFQDRARLLAVYQAAGNVNAAEKLYKHDIALRKRVMKIPDKATILQMMAMARFYAEHDRLDAAAPIYARALKLAEKSLPPKRLELKYIRAQVARFYLSYRRPAPATRIYESILASYKTYKPLSTLEADEMLNNCLQLGHLYNGRHDHAKTEAAFKQGLAYAQRFGRADSRNACLLHEYLADIYTETGRAQEAKEHLTRAIAMRERLLSKPSALSAEHMEILGTSRRKLKELSAGQR